ncbi:MAG: 4Fe-4S dicluster domain-containing protein [Thermodesulfobacteriota bacterium]|nr:4Fe-4S dicluster domain-containing protein [Thermodesulfobacteriota bacterium]
MSDFSRREFLKRSAAAGVAGGVALTGFGKSAGASDVIPVGTMIDLTRCDGCKTLDVPACVTACREENRDVFPEPIEDIDNYWPHKKKEDWSKKKELTSRLTPYNWTFLQNVNVEHGGKKYALSVPRRCMHCDNPPCANVCPFSVQHKMPEGPVVIDHDLCFGGAKCRDVCPWGIPARQAGVGLYLKIAPKLAGGGVMYKCDLCYSRIKEGREPACVEACPRNAIVFGEKEKMRALAHKRASEINGYIYGEKENGGTSTFYVSPVPFEKIHAELMKQKAAQPNPKAPGFPGMPVEVENFTETVNSIAWGMAIAPVAGIAAAAGAAYKTMKGGEKDA